MLANRRLSAAQLPSDREVQNYIATHPGDVRQSRDLDAGPARHMPSRRIRQLRAEIMDAHSMDQLVAVLQNNKVAFARQKNRLDTAAVPAELYAKLSSLPAGEPFALSTGGRTVTSAIAAREPAPIAGDQAKPIAVDAMRKAQTGKVSRELDEIAEELGQDRVPGWLRAAEEELVRRRQRSRRAASCERRRI